LGAEHEIAWWKGFEKKCKPGRQWAWGATRGKSLSKLETKSGGERIGSDSVKNKNHSTPANAGGKEKGQGTPLEKKGEKSYAQSLKNGSGIRGLMKK